MTQSQRRSGATSCSAPHDHTTTAGGLGLHSSKSTSDDRADRAYRKRLVGGDEAERVKAARAWTRWVSPHSYRCHHRCILLKMPAVSLLTGELHELSHAAGGR